MANKYKIPVRTFHYWENLVRILPDYILALLLNIITIDYGVDEATRDAVSIARQKLESED